MNKIIFRTLLIPLLLGTQLGYAASASCKYQAEGLDPATNEKIIQTKWDRLTTMFGDTKTSQGFVSAISAGDAKYLGIKLKIVDYYAFPFLTPYSMKYLSGPKKAPPADDPRYLDFLDMLLGDSLIVPEGSTLRITMADRSTMVLTSSEHVRARGNYTDPFQKRRSKKGLGGFLKKVAAAAIDAEIEGEDVVNRNFLVEATAVMRYGLDDEALAVLRKSAITSMRVETRDRYYALGLRNRFENVEWGKKSRVKVQKALQCVAKRG
ncbi:MAG: hypothetical protein IIA05_11085 [Proteobacteria bacterium]|nr:hypothetical protein [Pseudomonadota bacterium]